MNSTAFEPERTTITRVESLLDELDYLLKKNAEEETRLSIYVPAGPLPADVAHARLHLKNAVLEAEDLLKDGESEKLIALLNEAVGDMMDRESEASEFWQTQVGGLAIFTDDEECRILQVPQSFLPEVRVSPKFYLSPLLELAANVDSYWLLSLSQNEIALYRGSRLGIREVEIPGGDLSFETSETAAVRSSGDDPDLIDAEVDKENLERFFSEVDDRVRRVLKGSTDPLILAGVDFYLPLYSSANAYPYLVEAIVSGNAERQEIHDLHRRASDALRLEFAGSRRREYLRMKTLGDSDIFVGELSAIFKAAAEGRVKSLIVPTDCQLFGRVDDAVSGTYTTFESETQGGYDLYQEAAERVLNQGGTLFFLESAKMPNGYSVCAELRY